MRLPEGTEGRDDDIAVVGAAAGGDRSPMTQERGSGNGPPGSFDEWLDGRLKALYQTVLKEPLPREIVELLEGRQKGRNHG